ncbi:hypothetical protein MXB_3634 [Myxobolus squamalis]|nr:hypothetical protein MXB_3634 [Myxobolus squamalis]
MANMHSFIITNSLWFGRDPIGRKSMVINQLSLENFDLKSDFIISSVASSDVNIGWAELPAGYLYSLNFDKFQKGICKHPFGKNEIFCSNIIINNITFESYTSKFLYFLKKSISCRVSKISLSYNANSVAHIGILFSGGIDCTLIASIASEYLEPGSVVELLNVSFFNEKFSEKTALDRENGRESFQKLVKIYPHIKWIFVEINVSFDNLNKLREEHIKYIIYPSNTILDDSLGCCLWFASRGTGISYIMDGDNMIIDAEKYVSSSKVLLSGLGADELLCGYDQYYHCYQYSIFSIIIDAMEKREC